MGSETSTQINYDDIQMYDDGADDFVFVYDKPSVVSALDTPNTKIYPPSHKRIEHNTQTTKICKPSSNVEWSDKNDFVTLNFNGLQTIDKSSYLSVFGYINQFSKENNLYIPYDIIISCLIFYSDNDHYIKSFETVQCFDETKFEVSNNNKIVNAIYHKSGWYPIYCQCQNKQNGYNTGIHYAAFKYIDGSSLNAWCAIGITTKHTKETSITSWQSDPNMKHGKLSSFANFQSYWVGYKQWTKSSTMIMKLDLNDFKIYYYHLTDDDTKPKLIKHEELQKDMESGYYFVLCLWAEKMDHHSLEIVPCRKV